MSGGWAARHLPESGNRMRVRPRSKGMFPRSVHKNEPQGAHTRIVGLCDELAIADHVLGLFPYCFGEKASEQVHSRVRADESREGKDDEAHSTHE